jgi:hypothetical protein
MPPHCRAIGRFVHFLAASPTGATELFRQQVEPLLRQPHSSPDFAAIGAPNSCFRGDFIMPLFMFLPLIIFGGLWAIGTQQQVAPPNPE